MAGGLIVAALGRKKNLGKAALLMLTAFDLAMTSFALSKFIGLSCVFVFLAGAAMIAVFAMVTSLVQLITPNDMRGRVRSVYNVAFRGGMPIGSIILGGVIQKVGAPPVIAFNGALLFGLALWFLLVQRRVAALLESSLGQSTRGEPGASSRVRSNSTSKAVKEVRTSCVRPCMSRSRATPIS